MTFVPLKNPVPVPPTSAQKPKKEWAKEAAQYLPVFPLRGYVDPGSNASPEQREAAVTAAKRPLLKDWQNHATQDLGQIDEMWDRHPNANIGGFTQNHIVVDID